MAPKTQPEKFFSQDRTALCGHEIELMGNVCCCDLPSGHDGPHVSNDKVESDGLNYDVKVAWKEITQ